MKLGLFKMMLISDKRPELKTCFLVDLYNINFSISKSVLEFEYRDHRFQNNNNPPKIKKEKKKQIRKHEFSYELH